jgi:sec-independent protein translocase protein TatA
MNMPGIGELIVIFMIVLLLFGAGKIPTIAKDLGKGINQFKKAMSGELDEEEEKQEAKKIAKK